MTQLKVVTVALLGASGTGKKSLAQAMNDALTQALASTLSTPLHWKITTDTALQGLLARGDADVDNPSPEFHAALAQQRRFDHRLLLGLDLAPSAGALQIQSAEERSHIDTLLRRSLTQAGMPFQVIYGTGDERLKQALTALGALKSPAAKTESPPQETSSPRKPWVWACDKCSDPACEHKLLSDLLLNR
jgi:nicotinamide riboside kinase